MANRMTPQQLAASAFGGIGPTSQISTPVTGKIAPWQMADNYDPRFSGMEVQQPQQPGNNQAPSSSGLMQWIQGLYPDRATTPQPLGWDEIMAMNLGGAGTMGAAGAGGGAPAPAQITTGMTQPQMPDKPTMPAMGAGPQGIGGVADRGLAAGWGQAIQPAFMQAMANFYPAAQGLQGGFENARAQEGLGWGGLRSGQQSNLLSALRGLV